MSDQPTEPGTVSGTVSGTDLQVVRAAMRREKIAARLALDPVAHRQASARIQETLWQFLSGRRAGTLAFCWPIRAEVDCRPLVARLVAAGWRASMPTVVKIDAPMEFRAWWQEAPMTTDPYGIPVPDTDPAATPEVLLLPLVACDTAGYRLGYGGGYFDRTLAACDPRPLTIGIGFGLCMVDSIHPGGHDIPMNVIVTECILKSCM